MEIKDVRIVEQIYKSSMANNDRPPRNSERHNGNNQKREEPEMVRIQGLGEKLDEKA